MALQNKASNKDACHLYHTSFVYSIKNNQILRFFIFYSIMQQLSYLQHNRTKWTTQELLRGQHPFSLIKKEGRGKKRKINETET